MFGMGAMMGGKLLEWAFKLWPLWLAIILAIAAVVGVNVRDARIAREAQAAVRAELEPKLKQCEDTKRQAALALEQARKAISQIQESYAAQAAAMEELRKREAEARKRGQLEVAKSLAKERELRTRIDELRGSVAAPAPNPDMSCAEAEKILRDAATRGLIWEGDG